MTYQGSVPFDIFKQKYHHFILLKSLPGFVFQHVHKSTKPTDSDTLVGITIDVTFNSLNILLEKVGTL